MSALEHADSATQPIGRAARVPGGAEQCSPVDAGMRDPFPAGTGGVAPAAPFSDPVLTRSHPFPLGEGTGERVKTAFGIASEAPVPGSGNGWEQGTADAPAYPGGSIPLPFSIVNRPASPPTSTALIRSTAQPSTSWTPLDLAEIVSGLLAGTLDRPKPTVGRLADGSFCLYRGAVNGVAAEAGSGKTWFGLGVAARELEDGNSVIYIDFEDNPVSIVSRLLDLGVPTDVIADPQRFAYVRPDQAFADDVRADFWAQLAFMEPSLVVIDSTGESMALEGTDPNSDDAVARWFQRVASAIAQRGPAVLLLDHLPKADNAASSPIGSMRKKAAISGVQFTQRVGKGMSFSKGRAGAARLTCTKDRHGNFTTGEVVVEMIVNPEPSRGDSGVDLKLMPVGGDDWAPTRHMLEVSEFLASAGTAQSTSAIRRGVKGKNETIGLALKYLVESGYVVASAGPHNSTDYTSINPYSLGDPYTVPDGMSAGGAAGCEHEWHDGECKPDWCHETHYGSCNNL